MKSITSSLLTLLLSTPTVVVGGGSVMADMEERFVDWMKLHDKGYQNTMEMLHRMDIWLENHAFIEAHNNQVPKPSYTLGHNQFSDMTHAEYKFFNKLGEHSPGIVAAPKSSSTSSSSSSSSDDEKEEVGSAATSRRQLTGEKDDPPDSVNWVEAGAVVDVKNQGMCGSCWAFSAICAIEGAHYLDTGDLISLSEQELVDCDKYDLGCSGGLMDNAFRFDEDSPGICSEEDYPYAGRKRWFRGCGIERGECEGVEHTRVQTFIDVENTVEGLVAAIADQPVSVAIEADQRSFQFYKEGVYDDPQCGENLDHGVAAVGYGTTDDGQDYFMVRNSWGETWGKEGYILMSRTNPDSPNVNGTCGILGFASRPVLRDD